MAEESMSSAQREGTRRPPLDFRSWPILQLPGRLLTFVLAVIAVDAIAIGVALATTTAHWHQFLIVGLLITCSALTVEATKRAGENADCVIKDIFGVWELPVAILLPPVYALLVPIPRILLAQWRIKRIPLHRRVFNAAAIGLSYGGASVAFHAVYHGYLPHLSNSEFRNGLWILTVAACGGLQWVINQCIVLPAVKLSSPGMRIWDEIRDVESLRTDSTELCVGVLVTLCVLITPVTIAFAFPFVTLLQRSQRHSQLVKASRHDSKTGLLNAGTWEREANAEVARAIRTRTSLAVALIDVDSFKAVNDTHGHLSGDKALLAVTRTITAFLREYDLVGRFGGEEFALLLPHTDEDAARGIAERIRAHIADMPIALSDGPDSETIKVTVSIGVTALSTSGSQLTELLATADAALYRAKNAGRNQVWVTTDTTSARSSISADGYDNQPA
jgi:diguanylate cyclase (GGDEF)-like protein